MSMEIEVCWVTTGVLIATITGAVVGVICRIWCNRKNG